jgi:hypothetical protein
VPGDLAAVGLVAVLGAQTDQDDALDHGGSAWRRRLES